VTFVSTDMFNTEPSAEYVPSNVSMRPKIDVLYTSTVLWCLNGTDNIVNVSRWFDVNVNSGDVRIFPALCLSVQFSNIIAANNTDNITMHAHNSTLSIIKYDVRMNTTVECHPCNPVLHDPWSFRVMVTIRYLRCNFLQLLHSNPICISSRFRDIWLWLLVGTQMCFGQYSKRLENIYRSSLQTRFQQSTVVTVGHIGYKYVKATSDRVLCKPSWQRPHCQS